MSCVCLFCVSPKAEDQLNARAAALKKKSVQNAALMKVELKKVQAEVMAKREQ